MPFPPLPVILRLAQDDCDAVGWQDAVYATWSLALLGMMVRLVYAMGRLRSQDQGFESLGKEKGSSGVGVPLPGGGAVSSATK